MWTWLVWCVFDLKNALLRPLSLFGVGSMRIALPLQEHEERVNDAKHDRQDHICWSGYYNLVRESNRSFVDQVTYTSISSLVLAGCLGSWLMLVDLFPEFRHKPRKKHTGRKTR